MRAGEQNSKEWLELFLARLSRPARRDMLPLYVAGMIWPGDRESVQSMTERLGLGAWAAAPLKAELLTKADELLGGPDASPVIDDGPAEERHALGRSGAAARLGAPWESQPPNARAATAGQGHGAGAGALAPFLTRGVDARFRAAATRRRAPRVAGSPPSRSRLAELNGVRTVSVRFGPVPAGAEKRAQCLPPLGALGPRTSSQPGHPVHPEGLSSLPNQGGDDPADGVTRTATPDRMSRHRVDAAETMLGGHAPPNHARLAKNRPLEVDATEISCRSGVGPATSWPQIATGGLNRRMAASMPELGRFHLKPPEDIHPALADPGMMRSP